MEYALIVLLQLIGIGLHVMQKVIALGDQNKSMERKEIFATFWHEDWDTLFVSGLVLVLNLAAHYIIEAYTILPKEIGNYPLYAFGIALVLGYAGQRLIYKYLGTAEAALAKKGDQILNK